MLLDEAERMTYSPFGQVMRYDGSPQALEYPQTSGADAMNVRKRAIRATHAAEVSRNIAASPSERQPQSAEALSSAMLDCAIAAPTMRDPPAIIELQHTLGNRAVNRLLANVSPVGDGPFVQRATFKRSGVGEEPDTFTTETFVYGQENVSRERPKEISAYITAPEKSKETPFPISFEGMQTDPLGGYHRGHIIAYELGGPGHPFNIAPMLASFNTGPWKAWENETGNYARAVKRGHYRVHILLYYNGSDPRVPSHFVLFRERFTNEQGWKAHGQPASFEHSVEEVGLTEGQAEQTKEQLSAAQKDSQSAPQKFYEILAQTQFKKVMSNKDPITLASSFLSTGHLPPLDLTYPHDPKHRPYEELDILFLSGRLDVALPNGLSIGADFTENQKYMIRKVNMSRNGGKLMSDDPRDPYQELSVNGTENRPEIDHIIPLDRGGSNFFSNARIVSWALNNKIDRVKSPSALVDPSLVKRRSGNSVEDAVVEVLIRSKSKLTFKQLCQHVQKYRDIEGLTTNQEDIIKEMVKDLLKHGFVEQLSETEIQWVPTPAFRKDSF